MSGVGQTALPLDAAAHPLGKRADPRSVLCCKDTFVNVSKAFRTVAVGALQV